MSKDLSEFYKIYTPIEVPIRFCKDGYYRLAAKAECVKCGRSFPQVVRCSRMVEVPAFPLAPARLAPRPDPNDEKVISTFMLNACDHGVGCANRENFDQNKEPRFFEYQKQKGPMCGHPTGAACAFCVTVAVPYRRLKFAPHLHGTGCPIGLAKRTGPMMLTGMQTDRAAGRPRN